MGRPTKSEKRSQQLNLKLTPREMALLRGRAVACGMKLVDFGRAQLLAERVAQARQAAARHHLDPLFVAQVARIGNNLNQIARRLNAQDVPPPPALEPLLHSIRKIIRTGSADGT